MTLILNDKGLISERYLRQAIYFNEYARMNIHMSFILQCIQLQLISIWSKHAFIKQVPLIKKDFLLNFRIHERPTPDEGQLEALLGQLDQLGYIKYYPAPSPDKPDRFTMILLLKIRAYPQLVWKGQTFRGIKSLKKHLQLNAPLAVDEDGLKMADGRSPFAPSFKQVKDLLEQHGVPPTQARVFYEYYQYNDWIHLGKTMYDWEKVACRWVKMVQRDQLKT